VRRRDDDEPEERSKSEEEREPVAGCPRGDSAIRGRSAQRQTVAASDPQLLAKGDVVMPFHICGDEVVQFLAALGMATPALVWLKAKFSGR